MPTPTKGKGFSIQTRSGGQYVLTPDGSSKSTRKRKYRKSGSAPALKVVPSSAPGDVVTESAVQEGQQEIQTVQAGGEEGDSHVDA